MQNKVIRDNKGKIINQAGYKLTLQIPKIKYPYPVGSTTDMYNMVETFKKTIVLNDFGKDNEKYEAFAPREQMLHFPLSLSFFQNHSILAFFVCLYIRVLCI